MADFKPIETYYNGYRFRSRLEARWAVFFDEVGITYEYEPEGLLLHNGSYYLPDFYLPQFHCYFEVKRQPKEIQRSQLPFEEFRDAIQKISSGSYSDEWAGVIAFGDPYDHYMWIFCQDISDSSGGTYDNPVVFGINGYGEPILFSWNDYRERLFVTSFQHGEIIPMITTMCGEYFPNPFLTNKLLSAEKKARQARFEHGETPTTERI